MSGMTLSLRSCFALGFCLALSGCFQTTLLLDARTDAMTEPAHREVRWFTAGAPLGGSPLIVAGLCNRGIQRIEQVMSPAGAGVFAASLTFASSREITIYCKPEMSAAESSDDELPSVEADPFLEEDEPAPWEEATPNEDED